MRCAARLSVALSVLVLASATGACRRPLEPSSILTLAVEDFTGTIAPLGTSSHTFTVKYQLAYTDANVTVTSLTAVSNGAARAITIGVAFGNINQGVCTRAPSYTNPTTSVNQLLPTSDLPFVAGAYCVQIFDNPTGPTVAEPLNYALTVRHY